MMAEIVLGGGCFWCLDAAFRLIKGVTSVTSGYAGGDSVGPDYYSVATGITGHAEVVKVEFDPKLISLTEVLDIFWVLHDPTTLNRQGNDVGAQYRSIILYTSKDQQKIIEESLAKARKLWPGSIVTEVTPLTSFYPAEPEHQNYFEKHPEQAYCQVVINPKLQKLRQKFAQRLKA